MQTLVLKLYVKAPVGLPDHLAEAQSLFPAQRHANDTHIDLLSVCWVLENVVMNDGRRQSCADETERLPRGQVRE
jgi:hypothetical protein